MEKQPQLNTRKTAFPAYGWGLLVAALLINLVVFWPASSDQVELPYSTFLDQVQAGNVARVIITGSEIEGTLIKPVLIPLGQATSQPATTGKAEQSYQAFHTHFPEVVNDPNLVSLLNSHNVQIEAKPGISSWVSALKFGLPLALLASVLAWMIFLALRQSNGRKHPAPQGHRLEHPQVRLAQFVGNERVKSELQKLSRPLNETVSQPNGDHHLSALLLSGPAGSGKTLAAQAIAGESTAALLIQEAPTAQPGQIGPLFEQARADAPAVILLEDLDGIMPAAAERLLAELDQLKQQPGVVVLATTRRLENVDQAFLAAGRLDHTLSLSLPDLRERENMLRILTSGFQLAKDVNLGMIARTSTGLSGKDLANLCQAAALAATRKNASLVSMTDFEEALDQALLSAPQILMASDHERRVAAYHEAGHALIAWMTPAADVMTRISLLEAGQETRLPTQNGSETIRYSKERLLAYLSTLLGGRAAEEAATGEVTTRSENDLIEATRLARNMISRWGMGRLGPVAFDTRAQTHGEARPDGDLSQATAARIDQEVQDLLHHQYALVLKQLSDNRQALDRLVDTLLDKETIHQTEMTHLIGPRPFLAANSLGEVGQEPELRQNAPHL